MSEFVTTTSAAPAVWEGVVAVIDVLPTTTTFVAATPPMVTVAPETNPVPPIVTDVPPAVVPELGEMVVTVGAALLYVYPLARVPLFASRFVTTTLTVPAACAGVVAVIEVEPLMTTFVAPTPPKATVAPFWKPVPVTVTVVPPAVPPTLGETDVTVGALDPPARNVAICITHGAEEVVAVAL